MTPTAPLSALAAALHTAVTGSRRARVPIEELRQAALTADLSFAGSPDARRRLADAIRELEAAGAVTLPRTSAGWAAAPRPSLPRWVARPSTPKPLTAAEPPVSWHAALHWVPEFLRSGRSTSAESALLRSVNAFLGAGGSALVVPLRERSLQLIGDEKALDTASRGRLFGPGRLSLELIAARRVSPPVVRRAVGPGPVTLIVENYATYHSLAATLPKGGQVGDVVYGAGNTLTTVLTAIADAGGAAALAYFGDLDVRGLEIAAAGARLAAGLGLPAVLPAARLYRLLVDHGTPAVADGATDARRALNAVTWLPAPLRDQVLQVLLDARRLAQEAVGLELLTAQTPLQNVVD